VTWPDLFVISQFLELRLCEAIVAEMKAAQGTAATVYGSTVSGAVDQNVRRTLRIQPAAETVKLVIDRLSAIRKAVEEHFAVTLGECEEPQFLRYREGDFFVAHQDGNTGLLRLETEKRLISTVIFLSRESDAPGADFSGGSLLFRNLHDSFHMPSEPGNLVAFRSETTHEVTPVTHGERFSIASWFTVGAALRGRPSTPTRFIR
jgi:SM-20-related protein